MIKTLGSSFKLYSNVQCPEPKVNFILDTLKNTTNIYMYKKGDIPKNFPSDFD